MPKLVGAGETQDGSATCVFKIRKTHVFSWSFVTASITRSAADFAAPMKRSVRPVFSTLLLIAFAATLTCGVAIRRRFSQIELESEVLLQTPAPPVFNTTLLKMAAIDTGEAQSKHEIEQLLEGNFASRGRYRTFASWRKFNNHDIRVRSSRGIPIMLRSPEFYRQWLEFRRVLRDWARNKRYQAEIMTELVRQVKHPIDRRIGLLGSDSKYASCAVLGNSGILLNKEYGSLIDSHEVVIRLNNARTDRFERNVGAKTSISFVNSNILHLCARREGCFCHPYGVNVPIVMYICQPVHLLDYTMCNSSHKAPLLITDARFDVLCSRIVKYYSLKRFLEKVGEPLEKWGSAHDGAMFHYSSGMQAVMLALGVCEKVSIFGFGKSASSKHHYHTNQKAELRLHDYEAEYAFYHDLVKNPQAIPFISDKFKIPPVNRKGSLDMSKYSDLYLAKEKYNTVEKMKQSTFSSLYQ